MMKSQNFQKVIVLLMILKLALVSSFAIVLDRAQDEDIDMWSIKGMVEYFVDGNAISATMDQFLPSAFDYHNILLTKGIWVVVPRHCSRLRNNITKDEPHSLTDHLESKVDSKIPLIPAYISRKQYSGKASFLNNPPECNTAAGANFTFTLHAQLADSMKVRYLFGGPDAIIRIFSGDGHQLKELNSNNRDLDFWDEDITQLPGHAMRLEASVTGPGDYILIDSITVNTLEVTTTRPTTSTRKPPPIPTSGQSGMSGLGSLIVMMMSAVLILLK